MADICQFMEELKSCNNEHDRRVKIMIYLASSVQSSYYLPIKDTKNSFLKLASSKIETPKYNSHRYEIFALLFDEIKQNGGLVTKRVKLQLASDFTKRDLEEISYHLFKPSLNVDKIEELLLLYKETFGDNYFSCSTTPLTLPKTAIALIASDQSTSKFYYVSKNLTIKMCKIGNVVNQKKLQKSLRDRITNLFYVASPGNIYSTFNRLGVNINKAENLKHIKNIKFININAGVVDLYTSILDNYIIECCDNRI